MEIPKLGMKYSFVPAAFTAEKSGTPAPGGVRIPHRVTGTVTYIHRQHRWFQVTYEIFGNVLKECFKF